MTHIGVFDVQWAMLPNLVNSHFNPARAHTRQKNAAKSRDFSCPPPFWPIYDTRGPGWAARDGLFVSRCMEDLGKLVIRRGLVVALIVIVAFVVPSQIGAGPEPQPITQCGPYTQDCVNDPNIDCFQCIETYQFADGSWAPPFYWFCAKCCEDRRGKCHKNTLEFNPATNEGEGYPGCTKYTHSSCALSEM